MTSESGQGSSEISGFDPWRLLVDSVLDYAIFLLDTQGRIATWSRGAQAIKGFVPEEIIGKHFSTFYTPPDVAARKPEQALEIAARVGRLEDEGWRLRKDGSRFWASVIISALRGPSGELVGFAKVTRDMTSRRSAEEELRGSEERFRVLVESVSDYAIYMLDPRGNITTWNRGAEKLKGYTAQEIIGKNLAVFFVDEDVKAGKPQRELLIAKSEGRFEEESLRVRKDGTRFWANVVVTPIYSADGEHLGFAKVTRDLTLRVEAERTALELVREQAARTAAEHAEALVRKAAQASEEANRIKDEFLATVSHELRTPLSAILGWASLLKAEHRDPAVIKAANTIHRNALAQGKIIDDILDVSRIISGKLGLELRKLDVVSIVRDAVEASRVSASAKQIAIEASLPEDGACCVFGDAERLQQVVTNLLSNAIKFSDAGSRVTICVERRGAQIVVSVSDTGKGIEPAFLPHVFERFRQADSSSTRRHGGLGLGLAIVRHLVELHGGRVEAESAGPGRGAIFRVSLPTSESAKATAPRPPRDNLAALMSRGVLRQVRVVVVDDDDDARELAEVILARAGASVRTASSASDGVDAVRSFKPHVLISDVGMPVEDGYSLVRRVKALDVSEGGGIPSIALTAYASEKDRADALAFGFAAHITKPLEPEVLVGAVANLAALARTGLGNVG